MFSRHKRHLSRKKVTAARLGVSTRTLDRMVRDGRMVRPEYPFGPRTPLFDDDAVDAHVARLAAAAKQSVTA
jgi:hypothetical protein